MRIFISSVMILLFLSCTKQKNAISIVEQDNKILDLESKTEKISDIKKAGEIFNIGGYECNKK